MSCPNPEQYSAADLADFEAFIAMHGDKAHAEESDLQRWLRAHPGHSAREGKKGEPHSLRSDPVDPLAPKAGLARTRYVRQRATTYLAHTLHVDIRREAARDTALVWNPLARRYRLRSPEEAQERAAATAQRDRTADPLDSAPAPRERPDGAEPNASSARPGLMKRDDPPPGQKVYHESTSRPAAVSNVIANLHSGTHL